MADIPFPKIPEEFKNDWEEFVKNSRSGLKEKGLNRLKEIIQKAQTCKQDLRTQFIQTLCTKSFDLDEKDPLPHPLLTDLILPYLIKSFHEDKMPETRWLYQTEMSWEKIPNYSPHQILQKAIELDPQDFRSWELLYELNRNVISYGTHHMPESPPIDLKCCLESLKEIDVIFAHCPSLKFRHEKSINTWKRIFSAWEEYSSSSQDISFKEWCEEKGYDYDWPDI